MTPQWQGLLKNLGQWTGSFASFTTQGQLIEEVPSQLTLDLSEDEQSVGLCLNRYPQDAEVQSIEMRFNYPGPGPQIPFLEQGAFSQGALQYSRFSRFGAELSMIWGDRRLRIVQSYPSGSDWSGLTLICETRAAVAASPALTLDQLCGQWVGEAQTVFSGYRDPESYPTELSVQISQNELIQSVSFENQQIQSKGEIFPHYVDFVAGSQPMRLMLLPGGGSSVCPITIQPNEPFFLEAGWLIEPSLRHRLIRRYRAGGEWDSLTLVIERKQ